MSKKEKIPRRLRRFQRRGEPIPEGETYPKPPREEEKVLGFGKLYEEYDYKSATDKPKPKKRKRSPKEGRGSLVEELESEKFMERTQQLTQEKMKEFHGTHQRMPSEDEAGRIAEGVFEQAKEEFIKAREEEREAKREQREMSRTRGREKEPKEEKEEEKPGRRGRWRERRGKRGEKPVKEAPAPEEEGSAELKSTMDEVKGLSVEGLFDKEEKEETADAKMPAAGGKDGQSMEEELKLIGLEEGTGEEAPEGKSLFCPECGSKFTDATAAGKEVGEEGIQYTCPNCKKKVRVKK